MKLSLEGKCRCSQAGEQRIPLHLQHQHHKVPAPHPALTPCIPRSALTARPALGLSVVRLPLRILHGPAGDCSGSAPALRGERWALRAAALLGRTRTRCAALSAQPGSRRVCPDTHPRSSFQFPAKFHFPVPRKSRPAGRAAAHRHRRAAPPERSFSSSLRLPQQGEAKRRRGGNEEKERGSAKDGKHSASPPVRPWHGCFRFPFPASRGGGSRGSAHPPGPGPRPGPAHACAAGFRLWAMATLESLGLVGTIAEGDVVPVDSESDDSEDEQVGSGRRGRRGRAGQAALLAHRCYRRSRGRRAPGGGGDAPEGTSAPSSCSGRRRPAARMPGRRR